MPQGLLLLHTRARVMILQYRCCFYVTSAGPKPRYLRVFLHQESWFLECFLHFCFSSDMFVDNCKHTVICDISWCCCFFVGPALHFCSGCKWSCLKRKLQVGHLVDGMQSIGQTTDLNLPRLRRRELRIAPWPKSMLLKDQITVDYWRHTVEMQLMLPAA